MVKEITRIKKSHTVVPKNIAQANILLEQLGGVQDAITMIEAELKQEVDALKSEAAKKLQPLMKKRDNQINALFAFAQPRKDELTKNVRSVVLHSGTFGWRMTPPRVELIAADEDMIPAIKDMGGEEFIRVIEEIDRHALLAQRPVIPGITYVQSDEFFVVPNQKSKRKKTFTHTIDR